jgi:hypothetical protein
VALKVLEVVEAVFLEEPTRAALAFVVPLGVFIDLLACKIYGSCFICEHAYIGVGENILDKNASLFVSLFLFLYVPIIAQFLVSASTS